MNDPFAAVGTRRIILGQALCPEFPLIALFRFAGPLLLLCLRVRKHTRLGLSGQCDRTRDRATHHSSLVQACQHRWLVKNDEVN